MAMLVKFLFPLSQMY